MATIELPDTTVAVLQRIRAGWLPHKLSDGCWWWGRPSADDGFKLWHQGLVPTMSIVEPMNDDDKAVWTASLTPEGLVYKNVVDATVALPFKPGAGEGRD